MPNFSQVEIDVEDEVLQFIKDENERQLKLFSKMDQGLKPMKSEPAPPAIDVNDPKRKELSSKARAYAKKYMDSILGPERAVPAPRMTAVKHEPVQEQVCIITILHF